MQRVALLEYMHNSTALHDHKSVKSSSHWKDVFACAPRVTFAEQVFALHTVASSVIFDMCLSYTLQHCTLIKVPIVQVKDILGESLFPSFADSNHEDSKECKAVEPKKAKDANEKTSLKPGSQCGNVLVRIHNVGTSCTCNACPYLDWLSCGAFEVFKGTVQIPLYIDDSRWSRSTPPRYMIL